MEPVTIGEERRRRRRAGDPRITEADREIWRRVTRGDLAEEFQSALDADLENDPLLGDHTPPPAFDDVDDRWPAG